MVVASSVLEMQMTAMAVLSRAASWHQKLRPSSSTLGKATAHLHNWLACFLLAVMVSSKPHMIAAIISANQYGQARMPKLSRPTLVAIASLSLSMAAPHMISTLSKYQVSRPPASPQVAPTTAAIVAIAILFTMVAVLTASMARLSIAIARSIMSLLPAEKLRVADADVVVRANHANVCSARTSPRCQMLRCRGD